MVKVKSTTKKNTKKTSKVDKNLYYTGENHDALSFDPEEELRRINESIKADTEIKLPELATTVIEELKDAKSLSEKLNNDLGGDSLNEVEKKIDILTALSETLEKDINERMSKLSESQKAGLNNLTNNLSRTSFWGGVMTNW